MRSQPTVKNTKRSTTITIRKGKGSKTLAKGSKKIVAQAKATSKLRTGVKTPVRAYTPPPAKDTTAPGSVTRLTVGARTTSTVALSWTNPSASDLGSILVRRTTGATAPASPSAGTAVALRSAKATTVTDTGLAAGTQYSYAVFARDNTGNTSTPVKTTTSTQAAPDTTPPGPVTELTVGARTTTSVVLSWTNPSVSDLGSILVRRATGATAPASPSAGTGVTLGSAKATMVTDAGLAAGTQYSYAVFTRDTTGNTSTPVKTTTSTQPPPDTTPPPVPGNVSAMAGDGQVQLSWSAVTAQDLKDYVVSQATAASGPWTQVAGSPTAATSLRVSKLPNGTTVWLTVAARDTSGNTSPTATPVPATPAAPVDGTARAGHRPDGNRDDPDLDQPVLDQPG
ncbi:MAG: fibronectin type III domain-containing protein [Candidatus Nanopelagicales bacterium]